MIQAGDDNQYFSFPRWRRLIALHWESNKRRYLLAIPALAGLLATWETFLCFMDQGDPLDESIQALTFYWGIAVVGCLYASTIFAEFGSQAQGIAWLSVPASALEKLLCGLLFSAVLCFLVFTAAFYLADIPMVGICNRMIERQHRTWFGGYPMGANAVWRFWKGLPGDEMDEHFHVAFLMYFMLQGAFALGSVYFKRLAFLKTLVAVMVFILVFTVLEKVMLENSLPQGWHRMTMLEDWIRDADSLRIKEVKVSPWVTGPIGTLLLLGVAPAFWVVTYFRIKEKEV